MRRSVIVMALFCLAAAAFGQSDARSTRFDDPLLQNLVGRWEAPGKVTGRDVRSTLTAEWVLNHQFLQLKLEDTQTPSAYDAWIFIGYDFRSERHVVHWLDVFGGRFSETLGYGTRSGDSLRFVFEYGDGPFRNTLTWNAGDKSWHWLIESKDDAGRWKTFAEYDVKRPALKA